MNAPVEELKKEGPKRANEQDKITPLEIESPSRQPLMH